MYASVNQRIITYNYLCCTYELYRYLRATKWAGAEQAIKRLEDTLRWRRQFGLYDKIKAEYIEPEVCHPAPLTHWIHLVYSKRLHSGSDGEDDHVWLRRRWQASVIPRS